MDLNRRSFMQKTVAAGSMAAGFSVITSRAQGSGRTIKAALIGCGGRGSGAARDLITAANKLGVKIQWTAASDWVESKAKRFGGGHKIPADQCFGGANGYKKLLQTDAEIVLMATPPNFRPIHFEAAVNAGKHVFAEKPVAVDAPGIRRFLAAGKKGKEKGLSMVAGTQRRHQDSYRLAAHQIHNGAMGEILNGQVYWLGRVPWVHPRNQRQSDADYLVNNWVNWCMMSGDHIVEQHVHNIDIANWFIGRVPVLVNGFGGRARRNTADQYDFFSIDIDYGEGCHVHSMCRQVSGCYSRVGETFTGTEGSFHGKVKSNKNVDIKTPDFMGGNPYMIEHYDLLKAILDEKPISEAENVGHSTMVAIMGRMSAYTGQIIRWSDVMSNDKSRFYNMALTPTAEDFEKGTVKAPKDNVIPIPGK